MKKIMVLFALVITHLCHSEEDLSVSAYCGTGVDAHVKYQAFAAMDTLTGWCSKKKAGILFDIIRKNKPEVVVEIGVFGGSSLIPMAFALRENGKGMIYGIDPWDSEASMTGLIDEIDRTWWEEVDHGEIYDWVVRSIFQFQLQEHVELIVNTSEGTPPIYDIDLLHIDGNHSEGASFLDVTKWTPLVKSGGWIVLDDIHWSEKNTQTTSKAVNWLNEHCFKFIECYEQYGWGIWIKP